MGRFWVPVFEAVLLWLTALFVLSILSAVLYFAFRRINSRYVAERRASALLIYALMTPVTATLLLLLSLNPEWSEYLIGAHCHSAGCLAHRPQIKLNSLVGVTMLLTAFIVILSFTYLLRQQWVRSRQRLQILQALSISEKKNGYRVLGSPALLAWCTGFFRGRIYLSSGLLAALDEEQLKAVLAHERAHARRFDNLRRWVVHIVTAAWPGCAKRRFWQDFYSATEEACDRSAAAEMRSHAPVVQALAYLAGMGNGGANSATTAHDPLMRIRALQSPIGLEGFPVGTCLAIVAITGIHILVLTGFVHHLLEHSTGPMLSALAS